LAAVLTALIVPLVGRLGLRYVLKLTPADPRNSNAVPDGSARLVSAMGPAFPWP